MNSNFTADYIYENFVYISDRCGINKFNNG